jgi:hypothetical protein
LRYVIDEDKTFPIINHFNACRIQVDVKIVPIENDFPTTPIVSAGPTNVAIIESVKTVVEN